MEFWDNTPIDKLTDLITLPIHAQPLITPLVLLFIEESGIPVPVPGDFSISFVGYQVSKGVITYPTAFLILMVIILTGSSLLYLLSYHFGEGIILKFGKYVHLHKSRLAFVEDKFRRFGPLVIIFGRHIPGFRMPITVFAGTSKVKYRVFILSELLSIVFWIWFYLSLGQRLGPKTISLLHDKTGYVFFAVFLIVLIALFYFWFRHKKHKKESSHIIPIKDK